MEESGLLTRDGAFNLGTRVGMQEVEKHNVSLAKKFAGEVSAWPGFRIININPINGIVVIECNNATAIRRALQLQCNLVTEHRLRFCFHYYHSDFSLSTLLLQLNDLRSMGLGEYGDSRSLYDPTSQHALLQRV